jgi:hypothetical protein
MVGLFHFILLTFAGSKSAFFVQLEHSNRGLEYYSGHDVYLCF